MPIFDYYRAFITILTIHPKFKMQFGPLLREIVPFRNY